MRHDVEVRTLNEQDFVAIRTMATQDTIGEQFGRILPEVMASLNNTGASPTGPPFARYHAFEPDRVDMEAGFPVASTIADKSGALADGNITLGRLPGGRAAVVVHRGRYPDLGQAYTALEEWMRESGEASAGPPWEVYVVGMAETHDPMELVTEVVQPLR